MTYQNQPHCHLLRVEVDHDRTLNFAMAHNAVPLVKLIRVTNTDARSVQDVAVKVRMRPGFADPWTAHIEMIAPGSTWNVDTVDLGLRMQELVNLTEREEALLSLRVSAKDQPEVHLESKVQVLACNEWNGVSSLPHLLAAFVQPNHPSVGEVLAIVRGVLGEATGDPALDGYQSSDPGRVFRFCEAIYSAVQRLDVTYINPPASGPSQKSCALNWQS